MQFFGRLIVLIYKLNTFKKRLKSLQYFDSETFFAKMCVIITISAITEIKHQ